MSNLPIWELLRRRGTRKIAARQEDAVAWIVWTGEQIADWYLKTGPKPP